MAGIQVASARAPARDTPTGFYLTFMGMSKRRPLKYVRRYMEAERMLK